MKKAICVILALLLLIGVFAVGTNAICFEAIENCALQMWPPHEMHPWPNPNSSDMGESLYAGFLLLIGFLLIPLLMLYEPLFIGTMDIIAWLALPFFLLVSLVFRA